MREAKVCVTCGRSFTWRKKWARDWEQVRHCSQACRRGLSTTDRALEEAIVALLGQRRRGATICPSEASRRVAKDGDWRALMEPARRAARRLVAAGRGEICQKGRVVDPSRARGPIRLRLVDGGTTVPEA